MNLAIGFVHPEAVSAYFLHSLLRCRAEVPFQHIGVFSGPRIDLGRNNVVEQFLASPCDTLLFVDADIVFGPSHLKRIMASDEDIVSGLYFIGSVYDPQPVICHEAKANRKVRTRIKDWPRGEVIEVDATGCGFLRIKRPVLERMGESWFRQQDTGEDVYFCQQARRMGYRVMVDTGITLGHVKPKPLTIEDFDGIPGTNQDRRAAFFPE